ncbi:hypothetical protein ACPCG0_00995 [Propionibacteriaceae bacterium Y1923]|uniref:hypothetical protein n=1 Tax=Aestuariimicrobium sp. Y1814 TaxID=3418742 RepID=UPI003C14A0C2
MNRWTHFAVDSGISVALGAIVVLFGVRVTERLLRFASDDTTQDQAAQKLKGGAWIGALERLATYVCVVAHFLPGLAIIMAVKGLARYPELRAKDADVAERFIIGTFISVLLAAGAGALALWLTGLTR